MPLQEDYQVSVNAFCGPLDLLLFLIRRAEVDVNDIPVAEITDQYLAFLRQLDDIDVDDAGEFLVMAATLVEIKSRTLMPEAPKSDDDAAAQSGAGEVSITDPRYELIQQLLAYQRFRVASEALNERREAFARRFPRAPGRLEADPEDDAARPALELEDVHVLDLHDAYERIMSSIDFSRLGDHTVEVDDTPIGLHQEDLLDRLSRRDEKRLTLQDAFAGHSLGQRVGLFLATLELVRRRLVTVTQEEIDSPIELVLAEEEEGTEGLRD
jgi:segregation and condensation protein A